MIITVEKMREYLPKLQMSDLEAQQRLESLESLIRKYTNNNFQARNFRAEGYVKNGVLVFDDTKFKAGDTYQISKSKYNDGLYEIGKTYSFIDEDSLLITKVVYPQDIVYGVINLLKWDSENRDKVGIKSESLSRYSVTYYDLQSQSTMGYPSGLMAFLKPYMKAQF